MISLLIAKQILNFWRVNFFNGGSVIVHLRKPQNLMPGTPTRCRVPKRRCRGSQTSCENLQVLRGPPNTLRGLSQTRCRELAKYTTGTPINRNWLLQEVAKKQKLQDRTLHGRGGESTLSDYTWKALQGLPRNSWTSCGELRTGTHVLSKASYFKRWAILRNKNCSLKMEYFSSVSAQTNCTDPSKYANLHFPTTENQSKPRLMQCCGVPTKSPAGHNIWHHSLIRKK